MTIKNHDVPGKPSGVLLAITGDDDRYAKVRSEAMKRAKSTGQILILYDMDAPTFLGSPLPTWWSGEGSEDLFSRRLDQVRLRAAGRAPIADQVAEAEARGIKAFGWLPSQHGSAPVSVYAKEQGATTIVVPADEPDIEALEIEFEVIIVEEPPAEPKA